ncbi:hypothetical protein KV097_04980 [Mumia sp. zg.B17]|uniref:hypothetical protein n=1 Tax=Mumia sp. zg.B17 TaxID=2855446 RepID=UPI001C6EA1E5|nr:hypothetical protein [Mumia sp. zg.B17]MBW9205290.1 hypothetical protein [Mumia sp. zg.B17]
MRGRSIGRRATGALGALVLGAVLVACGGSDEGDPSGCLGSANGGTVVVQGTNTPLVDGVSAGVGSIDVDPDEATAILTVSESQEPAGVRSVPVTVGTTFTAAGKQLAVVQICRGSVTVDITA